MRIGKQTDAFSAIATSDVKSITVRGKDLCSELIGHVSLTDYFHFLVTGKEPTPDQRFFLDAVMVAIAEHGLVPSVQAARMTLAAEPDAMHAAVAAGILGCGSVVLGSAEACGRFLHELLEIVRTEGASFEDVAHRKVAERRAAKKAIPGYGHPEHTEGDPRATRLLSLADERGTAGDYVRMARAVDAVIPSVYDRRLPMNVSGAIPSVMLDLGFPLNALKGLPMLARVAGLIGHLAEEARRPIGFILSNHAANAITYDGERSSS